MTIEITPAVVDLVRRCSFHVCRKHYRLDLFDDVAADVLQRVWRRYDTAGGCKFGTFVYWLARYSLWDMQRMEERHDRRVSALRDVAPDADVSPDEVLDRVAHERRQENREARIRAELYALGEVDFDIVFSSFGAGETMKDISARIGIDTSNVSRRRRAVVERLREVAA